MQRQIFVFGALLAALLSASCASSPDEASGPPARAQAPPSEARPSGGAEATPGSSDRSSNRRIFGGCDPAEEAARYSDLVGENVLITFAWESMGAAGAGLKAPAVVRGIEPPYVVVAFDPRVHNLELFTSVWSYSGHIRPRSDGTSAVDPCSASFEKGGW